MQRCAEGRTSGMAKRGYHHGNLRQALIDAALERSFNEILRRRLNEPDS